MLAALFPVIVYLLQDIFHIDPLLGTSFLAATGCNQATAARGLETVVIDPLITPLEGEHNLPNMLQILLAEELKDLCHKGHLAFIGPPQTIGACLLVPGLQTSRVCMPVSWLQTNNNLATCGLSVENRQVVNG